MVSTNENTNNAIQNIKIKCYDNSFLLISIAIVNLIAAFIKLNSTNLSTFLVCDSGFLLPVIILILTSIDIIIAFWGIKRDCLVTLAKISSILSLFFSGAIFILDTSIFCKVLVVSNDGTIEIVGNVVNYFFESNMSLFNQKYLLVAYFFSAFFQFLASIFKIFYNRKQRMRLK